MTMGRGHCGKPFYCRDWAFEKLRACLDKRSSSATCGTLIMADSGCGKTAFCSELVWPSRTNPTQTELHKRLLGYHFCSVEESESLSLPHFLLSLSSQLCRHDVIGDVYRRQLPSQFTGSMSLSCIKDTDEFALTHIINPLNSMAAPNHIFYLLVDGLDECDDSPAVNSMKSRTVPQILSKYHKQFPHWLALVCSCSTKAKRVSRQFTGFRKLSLDDITKSHVIQDIQQYILHRLDADDSLRRHLNKDTAEILDKLHVKCNGCILYIELILDLVAQHSVSLRQVSNIPGTLGGLYMWMSQQLFPDVSHYLLIARPLFNLLLASRHSLTSNQIYNCLATRNPNIKFEEFTDCIECISKILVNVTDEGRVVFSHPSIRLWLQDVKFCSRTYLCDVREGHEMLTLYYTVRGQFLKSQEVCEFAHHIQKCNSGRPINSNSQPNSASVGDGDLSLHEQAVWMILSQAELRGSPTAEDDAISVSMVDSCMMDSACMSVSALDSGLHPIDPKSLIQDHPSNLAASNPSVDAASVTTSNQSSAGHVTDTQTGVTEVSDQAPATTEVPADNCQLSTDITISNDSAECAHNEPSHDTSYCVTKQSPVVSSHVIESVTNQSPAVDDEDDYPDELECLDEDLLDSGDAGCMMDSELDSLGSPATHQDASLQGDVKPQAQCHPQTEMSHTSRTVEDVLIKGDIMWLETALSQGLDVNIPNSDGNVPLVLASAQGQLEAVEMLVLVGGAEVNLPSADRKTAIREASWHGHESIVSFLLNNDADVNRADKEGRSPLFAASRMGYAAIVEQLLASGADVDGKDDRSSTPLCAACSCENGGSANHVEVVKLLIQSGCDINSADRKLQTPLHLASHKGNLDICSALLSSPKVCVDAVDDGQKTPLLCAVSQGHFEVVKLLIASGADVHHLDQEGRTSLGLACLAGHERVVTTFLEMGQDEMHRDNYGVDCLHFSALRGHAGVTELLLKYGADSDSQDDQGRTSLFLAAQEGHERSLNVLLSEGASVDLQAHNGKTPLRMACAGGHIASATSLLSHGPDVDYQDMEGRTIIYILALENKPDCIRLLVEAGADINSSDEQGRTALHVACWQGHVEVITALLDLDADTNAEDSERRTPLQSAAWQGHSGIAEMLCERGAEVNHMCDQGATPLCISAQEGFLDVVSILCQYGADPNHADRYGRTALKIAMKANNQEMLHVIENIMRRYKPSKFTSDAARSRVSDLDQSETAVYENCSTNHSDQSERSSVELVTPYAVISLPRDGVPKHFPELIQRRAEPLLRHSHSSTRSINFSSPVSHLEEVNKLSLTAQHVSGALSHQSELDHVQYLQESQQRRSTELQQLQAAARSQQMLSVAKVSRIQQEENAQRQLALKDSHMQSGTKNQQRSAASHKQRSVSSYKVQSVTGRSSQHRPDVDDEGSSNTSEGCDTAPSTLSSTREDKSDSSRSVSPAPDSSARNFTQQLVQLGHGTVPHVDNVEQILSGEVGYMANPRVNRALYSASLMAAPNNDYVRSGVGRLPRQLSKLSNNKGSKMASVQNTARVPTYKVQYAAADHPQALPAAYAVRKDELMSAEHSLSSVKSRQAKIVSSRPNGDSTSLNSYQDSSRGSPPPMLPPRKGRQPQPPLHSNVNSSKPTLVGVVRPRAQLAAPQGHVSEEQARHGLPAPHRGGQKETSL